jgi:hypothetical protein
MNPATTDTELKAAAVVALLALPGAAVPQTPLAKVLPSPMSVQAAGSIVDRDSLVAVAISEGSSLSHGELAVIARGHFKRSCVANENALTGDY